MKLSATLSLLLLASPALADDGYWRTSTGEIWRTQAGACWHTSAWSADKAVPGCDGVPLTPQALPQAPQALPTPAPVVAPSDSDQDGVTDDQDRCASTPAGVAVTSSGCPMDADADGVPDYQDRCAGTPPGAVVDEAGCPKKLDREVSIGMDVHFVTGKADIEGDAGNEIRKVATFMKQYPAVKIAVEGYTDNQGGALKNKKLSQARADSVKAALVAAGVDASRLSAVGFGPENPVADNNTEEGRAKNRRVVAHAKAEVTIVELKKK